MFSRRLSFRQLPVTNNFHFIRFLENGKKKLNNFLTATAAKEGIQPQKYHGKLLTRKTSSAAVFEGCTGRKLQHDISKDYEKEASARRYSTRVLA